MDLAVREHAQTKGLTGRDTEKASFVHAGSQYIEVCDIPVAGSQWRNTDGQWCPVEGGIRPWRLVPAPYI